MTRPHLIDYAKERLHPVASWYRRISHGLMFGRSPFLLFIRLYIGWQSYISGKAHLSDLKDMTDYFTSLRIPMPHASAIISGVAESVGGIMLALGLFSRPVAAILTGNFLVAILANQLSNFDFSVKELLQAIWDNQNIILKDTAFPFFATALIVLLFGPGKLSVDRLILRHAEPQFDR